MSVYFKKMLIQWIRCDYAF